VADATTRRTLMDLTKSWLSADDRFGNLAVIGFLLVQSLDGVYTYLGFSIWGLDIEANPLIRTAVGVVGPGTGLALAKIVAISFGIMLHLRRVHYVVAILTAIYIVFSIVPWTTLLFLS
jgi:hypothetical protein